MKKQETLIEGQTKKFYSTDQDDQLVMEFTDTLPQGGSKKSTLKGKSAINAHISAFLFEYLESYNVPTHFVKQYDKKSLLVKNLEMFPFRMLVWNIATGSLAKRLGFKDGTVLETPVLELYLKNKKLKYPLINDYHAYALGLCERTDMNSITRIGTKINAVLKSFFNRKNLALVNFYLEFGRSWNQVILGDEISPDVFVTWEILEGNKFDKQSFSLTSGNAKEVYKKLQERLSK